MRLFFKALIFCAIFGSPMFVTHSSAADDATEAAATPADTLIEVAAPVEAAAPTESAQTLSKDLVLRGDARCTQCHDESDSPQLLAIGKTLHGVTADVRTPTCTSCHGDSDKHVNNTGQVKPDRTFGKYSATPPAELNAACLSCHQKDANRHLWMGSIHESRGVACSSCHQIHAEHDKVRDRRTQADVCFTCHKEQRAQINRLSHHPIPEGKMGCSDCHNTHGSAGPKLMNRDSVNETCYTCHMEKRGPFAHNHDPVTEDCSICHNPHGTTAESMLKMRPPFLCQTCHTPHLPIQSSLTGQSPPSSSPGWWSSPAITQGRSCLNCHTQVHGSNNPSAANPAPQNLFR